MKDSDKQREFIELRSKNWSFQRICDEIEVSKPTLIKWNKEFKYEIETLTNIVMEGLYHEYEATKKQRLDYLGNLHQKLVKELQNRDLSDVKTDKLLEMVIKTSDNLENITQEMKFMTEEDIEKQKRKERGRLELFG